MCLAKYRENAKVRFDAKELDDVMPSGTRRPYYTIRGKAVTPEQARQIIINEEPLFLGWPGTTVNNSKYDIYRPECLKNFREDRGILRNLFYRQGYSWLNTWLFTDGTIGMNSLTLDRYPEVDEFIPQWIDLGLKYDFLDMVLTLTDYEEAPCAFCNLNFDDEEDEKYYSCSGVHVPKCKEALSKLQEYYPYKGHTKEEWDKYTLSLKSNYFYYNKPDNMDDSICIVLWMRNGEVDILTGQKAINKSKEYEKLYYNEEDKLIYCSEYFNYNVNCICNKEYIIECFDSLGLNGEDCYKQSIVNNYIKDIPENLYVVHGVK